MNYNWDFNVVFRNFDVLLQGLSVTFYITVWTILIGFIVALLLTLFRVSSVKPFRYISLTIIEVFRDLPVLVILVWLFFCLPIFIDNSLRISPTWVAIIGLAVNFAALEAEILRAGYSSIPDEQIEIARSIGLKNLEIYRFIIVPQAFWRSIAPTLGQIINTIKLTALASFIAVSELFLITTKLIQETQRTLEFYTVLALMYLIIILPLSLVLQFLEKKMAEVFNE